MNEELPDLGLEVGDLVEGYGLKGEVITADNCLSYPTIAVRFKQTGYTRWFLPDGRYETWHKIPLLKLIEKKIKPKRKVTLRRYTYEHGTCLYQTGWVDGYYLDHNSTLVKTETKEIELD